jgi:hypothetical protein
MHTVTLDPTTVTVTPGGSPVVQVATIESVPVDMDVSQVLSFAVGATNVDISTTVTVDHPQPVASGTAADAAYTLAFATPVQDGTDPSKWTVEITYTPA